MIVPPRLGARDAAGQHQKLGLDDRLVQFGNDEFRRALTVPAPLDLEAAREAILQARLDSLGKPGIYFDGSSTGVGKTTADAGAIAQCQSSLALHPSHEQCEEFELKLLEKGISARAYPALTEETCQNYDTAERAIGYGLPVSSAVCPTCKFRNGCCYRDRMAAANNAAHRIATHKRASLGLLDLAGAAEYIAIHEDPAELFCPTLAMTGGFDKVATIARYAQDLARGDEAFRYLFTLETIADRWAAEFPQLKASACIPVPLVESCPRPRNDLLFQAIEENKEKRPPASALQFVQCLALGRIRRAFVDVVDGKDQEGERRTLVAMPEVSLPAGATVWISDATADIATVRQMVGDVAVDATPVGKIAAARRVLQVPRDILQTTSPRVVARLVRGILDRHPAAQKVGVIGHRRHVARFLTEKSPLDLTTKGKIAHVGHFRGTASRGSNKWQAECDLLIVLGTPRVPPEAIKKRLIQFGLFPALLRPPEWGPDYWSGITEDGRRRTVRSRAYRDHDWHFAYRSVVRSELLQAAGRARSLSSDGIPAVIVSVEELGLPLADWDLNGLSESELVVLAAMQKLFGGRRADPSREQKTPPKTGGQLTDISPITNAIGKMSVSSPEKVSTVDLVPLTRLCERHLRRLLSDLTETGHVEKVGKRGGWRLRTHPRSDDRDP